MAEDMLRMKVNKKMLQQHMSTITQKVITLKDLTNIQTSMASRSTGNKLSSVVQQLHNVQGELIECLRNLYLTCMNFFAIYKVQLWRYLLMKKITSWAVFSGWTNEVSIRGLP